MLNSQVLPTITKSCAYQRLPSICQAAGGHTHTHHQATCAGTMTGTGPGLNDPIPQAGLFLGNLARSAAGAKLQMWPGTRAGMARKSAMAPGALGTPQLSHKLQNPQVKLRLFMVGMHDLVSRSPALEMKSAPCAMLLDAGPCINRGELLHRLAKAVVASCNRNFALGA